MNIKLLEKIASKIITHKEAQNFLIVAICGAADLGKSYISVHLKETLCQMGLTVNHLTLDSYLMNRSDRIKNNISGYQPEAYDFLTVKKDLKKLEIGKEINFYPYDHSKGKKSIVKHTIKPCSVLILDGLHSMSSEFKLLNSFSIFLSVDDAQLKEIRQQADITKRNQTIEFSNNNSDVEFGKYTQYVAPYREVADIVLFLRKQWDYILVES